MPIIEPERVVYPPLGTWVRKLGDQWSNAELRDTHAAWADLFVQRHNWTDRWEIHERIVSTGIAVMLPRNPTTQLGYKLNEYVQRHGERVIVVRAMRPYISLRFAEVALTFAQGNDTPIEVIASQLDMARRALEAQA